MAAARVAAGKPAEEEVEEGAGGEYEIEAVDVLAKLPKDFNEKIFAVRSFFSSRASRGSEPKYTRNVVVLCASQFFPPPDVF